MFINDREVILYPIKSPFKERAYFKDPILILIAKIYRKYRSPETDWSGNEKVVWKFFFSLKSVFKLTKM